MKNSVKRFFSMIVALAMILSNMPLSLAEGLPEDTAPAGDAAPAVIELSGELAEENTESKPVKQNRNKNTKPKKEKTENPEEEKPAEEI